MTYSTRVLVAVLSLLLPTAISAAPCCNDASVCLQVLGSGGPELDDERASSGYLVWVNGHARVLVDLGPGSLLRFEESKARVEDLELVLLSHLHVDHSADLPALIKGSFFTSRDRDLPLYGPSGNALMPNTTAFAEALFADKNGAYRYLSDYLDGGGAFRLLPHDVSASDRNVQSVWKSGTLAVSAVGVHHGPIPALAWRVETGNRVIVFSGDMNADWHTLPKLAADADLLVAHHAIPQGASGVARKLHMPPSVIGEIAAEANVKQLVLSHRMNRTLGLEEESEKEIRAHYSGPVTFAEDGQCMRLD